MAGRLRHVRGRVVLSLAVIVGALVWVAAKGLTNALVYYKTPTEVVRAESTDVGQRMRLGGYVIPGSVQDGPSSIRFVITDFTTRVTVIDTGSVPALFRAGQGVVVEGAMGRDGAFRADTVLVKHNGVYAPPSPGETPTAADLQG